MLPLPELDQLLLVRPRRWRLLFAALPSTPSVGGVFIAVLKLFLSLLVAKPKVEFPTTPSA